MKTAGIQSANDQGRKISARRLHAIANFIKEELMVYAGSLTVRQQVS
jgi:hypothetical protein